MEKLFVCIVSSLLWSFACSCTTPLGRKSQCTELFNCPTLLGAFKIKPVPEHLALFLKGSHCGYEGSTPKVCCGPLPSQNNDRSGSSPSTINVRISDLSPDQIDPVSDEDSRPAPRNSCGVDTNGDRIYGGTATELDEFPWMAQLGYRLRNGLLDFKCGGVLINKRYVLTAAHCIIGEFEIKVGKLELVRLGEYDKRTEIDCHDGVCADKPQDIPVQLAVANPNYKDKDKSRGGDIGLARLARRARYNYYVQPICLVSNRVSLDDGIQVVVAGWGKTESGKPSDVKEKLAIPIFNKNECMNKYTQFSVNISDQQICAGGELGKDSCKGDSGGPLMRRSPEGIWESVGVVSFGYKCGQDGWPGIYTSISHYVSWIDDAMQSNNV